MERRVQTVQFTHPMTHGALVLVDLLGRLEVRLVRRDLGIGALPITVDCYPLEGFVSVTATVADCALCVCATNCGLERLQLWTETNFWQGTGSTFHSSICITSYTGDHADGSISLRLG